MEVSGSDAGFEEERESEEVRGEVVLGHEIDSGYCLVELV